MSCRKPANMLELLTALFSQVWPFLSTYKNRAQVRACFLLVALQPAGWAVPKLGLAPQGGRGGNVGKGPGGQPREINALL